MEVMAAFYAFVQREELALDEAEMPPGEFAKKLEFVQRMQQQMEAQRAQLEQMSPEQQQAYAIAMHKQMMNLQQNGGDQAAMVLPQQVGFNQAMVPGQAGRSMTQEEQMAFFQSLSRQR